MNQIKIPVTRFILPETSFCEMLILSAEFKCKQMETVWQQSNPNGLRPNALNHIIDLISSHLAESLTDLALLLGSTTKSFKFMSLLAGASGIPPPFCVVLFLQRVSSAIKKHNSNGRKPAVTLGLV